MTIEHFRRIPDQNSSFLECATLAEEERNDYGIESKYLGLWTKRSCPKDNAFDVAKQRCVDRKRLHRQQALCASSPVGCPYVCAGKDTDSS
jgi:hypothetical protein